MKKYLLSYLIVNTPLVLADSSSGNLSEMVVTATRIETPQHQLATATTVYTREDIERRQVKTLPDLLKGTSGLDLTQQGGYGKIASVFMRGTNSDQVLVLIDGIRIGSVTAGTSPYEYIPIDQIERVEITRGPTSSIYGSEAIGGVIQIFTRGNKQAIQGAEQEESKPRISLEAGGGSYDTAKVAGNVSGHWQNTWYNLGVAHLDTQGINARRPISGPFGFNQPDRDPYDNTSVNARLGHRFANQAELEAFFLRAEGDNAYDADYGGDHNDFINQNVGIKGSLNLLDNWRSTLNLGQSRNDMDSFCPDSPSKNNFPCLNKPNAFDTRFDSTRWNVSWLNALSINKAHTFNFGADYRFDEIDATDRYDKTSRYDVGLFGNLQSRLWEKHYFNASLRWDHNEAAGSYVTGNFGWRFQWDYGLSAFANFGNAFKAPTFNQLYYPNYGNPHLKAEQSTAFEVGVGGKHSYANWEVRAYHTDLDNLIVTVTDPVTFNSHAENVDKAQIDGIEAELGTHWAGWNAQLNLNLLSPVNRTTNARLPRRADKMLAFDLSRSFGNLDVGVNVLAQSLRYDNAVNSKTVAGFVTADLRSSYHLNSNWAVSAHINNILDKDYQTVDTYNSMGRNFFLSIHYNN